MEAEYSQSTNQNSLLGKTESRIIQYLFGKNRREDNDYERLKTVLDLVLRANVHLEWEVNRDSDERLRNEEHLVVE